MDLDFIKSTIIPPLVRLVVNALAGILLSVGISQGSATEVIGAVAGFLITIVWSLFQRKADIATPPAPPTT